MNSIERRVEDVEENSERSSNKYYFKDDFVEVELRNHCRAKDQLKFMTIFAATFTSMVEEEFPKDDELDAFHFVFEGMRDRWNWDEMKRHEDYFSRHTDILFSRCEKSYAGKENSGGPKFPQWVKDGLKKQLVDLRTSLLENRHRVSEWFVLGVQLFWAKIFDLKPDISIVQYFYFISQIRDIACAVVETFNKKVVRLFRDKARAHGYDEGAEDKLRISQNGKPALKQVERDGTMRWVWNIDFRAKVDSWVNQWKHVLTSSVEEKANASTEMTDEARRQAWKRYRDKNKELLKEKKRANREVLRSAQAEQRGSHNTKLAPKRWGRGMWVSGTADPNYDASL